MKIQMSVIKNHPIHALRHYAFTQEGREAGELRKSYDGRWYLVLSKNLDAPLTSLDAQIYHAPSYHAAVRVAACFFDPTEAHRIPYLLRGIWTNPCPTPEKIL